MLHLARSLNTSVTRCLMAGLACGILAALLTAGYTYLYGKITDFSAGMLLSPLTFFYGAPIVFLVAGFVLFEMVEYVRRGRLIFTILFLVLTALTIMVVLGRYEAPMEGLMLGITLINGLLLAFLLPYLATHPKIFMHERELAESEES